VGIPEFVGIAITWGIIITCLVLFIVYGLRRYKIERDAFHREEDENLFGDFELGYPSVNASGGEGEDRNSDFVDESNNDLGFNNSNENVPDKSISGGVMIASEHK
jgi:hypothetical protein